MAKSFNDLNKDKDNYDAGRPNMYGSDDNKPERSAKKQKSNSPSKSSNSMKY